MPKWENIYFTCASVTFRLNLSTETETNLVWGSDDEESEELEEDEEEDSRGIYYKLCDIVYKFNKI